MDVACYQEGRNLGTGKDSGTSRNRQDEFVPVSGKSRIITRKFSLLNANSKSNSHISGVQQGGYATSWLSTLRENICRVKRKLSKITNQTVENEDYFKGELYDTSKNRVSKKRLIPQMYFKPTCTPLRSMPCSTSSSISTTMEPDSIIEASKGSQLADSLISYKFDTMPLVDKFSGGKYINRSGELVLDSLSFFILDLLATPADEQEPFIVSQAQQRGILVKEQNTWRLHPFFEKQNAIFRTNYDEIYRNFVGKTFALKEFGSPFQLEISTNKRFEDFVNSVVHDGLPIDQHLQYSFHMPSKSQRDAKYIKDEKFEELLEEFSQKCASAGLGIIVEEEVRISAKNNDLAFLKVPQLDRDAIIYSQLSRKFALHGDIVRAFVRIVQENDITQKHDNNALTQLEYPLVAELEILKKESFAIAQSSKAFVIKIVKEVNSKLVVGTFLPHRKTSTYITFIPRDMRMPNVRIYQRDWPSSFKRCNFKGINEILYLVEIVEWEGSICVGKVVQSIGKCGELDSEKRAIMLKNNLSFESFDRNVNKMFNEEFHIPLEERKNREDCTRECIFTIDPLGAKDLDDAMSIRELYDGNFEVGVHISDVSYFVAEDTELDKHLENRTTSVYLVDEVFHMLPESLSLRCSLLPGRDKMAFSVFWKMSRDADILSTRYSRTIIRSCTQLAYQQAQKIIDNSTLFFSEKDIPRMHNGYTVDDVVRCVKQLNGLATILRNRRFKNGVLKIDRPKIFFVLDAKSGEPLSYKAEEQLPANFLVEEFMLLANQFVATFIYSKFPDISILRNHQPPLKNVLKRIQYLLQKNDMLLEVESAKSIFCSLKRFIAGSENPKSASVCLSHLLSKPMTRAKYFCSRDLPYEKFSHYALSIPIYTHFTSPIRRYSDILVHRLLAAALDYVAAPKRSPAELKVLADRCNDDKYNAKQAGEDSAHFYFMRYLQRKGPLRMLATVVEIYESYFDAILVETGMIISVKWKDCSKVNVLVSKKSDGYMAKIVYRTLGGKEVDVKLCTEIWVEVTAGYKQLKGKLVLPPIEDSDRKVENKAKSLSESGSAVDKSELPEKLNISEAHKLQVTAIESAIDQDIVTQTEGIAQTTLDASSISQKVLQQSLELSRLLRYNNGLVMQLEKNELIEVPNGTSSMAGSEFMAEECGTESDLTFKDFTVENR